MAAPDWRRTELTRDLIRCDLCRERADTAHFHTDGGYPKVGGNDDRVEVVFACPKHDADGYWIALDDWFNPDRDVSNKIEAKTWGRAGVEAINVRFARILRDAAEADRNAATQNSAGGDEEWT